MYIFLPRLTESTTQKELLRVAREVLSRKFHVPFTEPPKLHSCSVLQISDTEGCIEHHGKLCIEPDSAAEWFIQHIKEKKLHNKRLVARQYFHREQNRRVRLTNPEGDRRRQDLKAVRLMPKKAPTFIEEGMDSFRAEHGG